MTASLWWLGVVAAGLWVALVILSFVMTKVRAPGFHVDGKHVFITGGSAGLGLSVAKKYARQGAKNEQVTKNSTIMYCKVSIIARGIANLESAKTEIEAVRKHPHDPIFIQSCDVADFDAVQSAVDAANAFHNRVTDHVLCCAGYARHDLLLTQDIRIFRQIMAVNYFGALYAIKATLPAMVKRNCEGNEEDADGQIVLVSSGLGLLSWIGSTQYSATKFALRGLAESLRNEVKLYGIRVSIFYPGVIDSPGYAEENKSKPEETRRLEGSSEMLHPDTVADSLIAGLKDGHYAITNDPMIFMLRVIANGVAPRFNTFLELVLLPLIVPIQMGFGVYMDYVVHQSRKARVNKAKAE